MPLYDLQCDQGHRFERMIPLAKFEEPVICACTSPARRLISAPMFTVDQTGYTCPVTNEWVSSKHQHRENLAKHNCRVLETGETEAAAAYRAKQDAILDKTIEDTVERQIEALPSEKKEQLHNELINGKLDLAIDRAAV